MYIDVYVVEKLNKNEINKFLSLFRRSKLVVNETPSATIMSVAGKFGNFVNFRTLYNNFQNVSNGTTKLYTNSNSWHVSKHKL